MTERISGASVSLFRILFGLFLIWDAFFFAIGREAYFQKETIHFKYPGFEFWPNATPLLVMFTLAVLGLCGVLITLGLWTRIASFVSVCLIGHLLLQNAAFYLNHLVLVAMIAFVLTIVPSDRYFAVKTTYSRFNDRTIARYELYWVMGLFQMAYFLGGVEKLRMDWFSGNILLVNFGLSARNGNVIANLIYNPTAIQIGVWLTLIVELFAPFGLLLKRARLFVVIVLFIFHLFNHLVFHIGLFSFLMMAAFVLYFEPQWPLNLIGGKMFKKFGIAVGLFIFVLQSGTVQADTKAARKALEQAHAKYFEELMKIPNRTPDDEKRLQKSIVNPALVNADKAANEERKASEPPKKDPTKMFRKSTAEDKKKKAENLEKFQDSLKNMVDFRKSSSGKTGTSERQVGKGAVAPKTTEVIENTRNADEALDGSGIPKEIEFSGKPKTSGQGKEKALPKK